MNAQRRRNAQNTPIYNGENLVAEYDGSGDLLASYFHGPGIDNPVSMTRDGQTYYYHTDALGSVTELTDSAGNVVQSYRYDAFGSIIQQSGAIENPFTYTGRELDEETGVYYYRARYYGVSLGRFISRDKLEKLPISYIYTSNSPINLTDPTGHYNFKDCSASERFTLQTSFIGAWVAGAKSNCL